MRRLVRTSADLVVAGLMLLAVPWLAASLISSILTLHIKETDYGFEVSGPVRLKHFPRKIVEVEPGDKIEWIKAEGLSDWHKDKPCGEVYPKRVLPLPEAPCGAPIFAISFRDITARELDERARIGWPRGSGFSWQEAQGKHQVTDKGWLYIWYNYSWWLKCEYWPFKTGIASGCGTYRLRNRYYYETPDRKARWSFKILK